MFDLVLIVNLHYFRLILMNFNERMKDVDLNNKSNVLAGIIQTNGINLNTANVVVLASGTKNIDAESLSPDTLPDTHAEVVARRALMFYFYQQLQTFLTIGMKLNSNIPIFENCFNFLSCHFSKISRIDL